MIEAILQESSVSATVDRLHALKQQIFAEIRAGVEKGTTELAEGAAGKVHNRSGDLAAAVLRSPRVRETEQYIKGTVSSDVGGKHTGKWVEFGVDVPAVIGTLMVFTGSDGSLVFTRGRKPFKVVPHPFMLPTSRELNPQIYNDIAKRIREVKG